MNNDVDTEIRDYEWLAVALDHAILTIGGTIARVPFDGSWCPVLSTQEEVQAAEGYNPQQPVQPAEAR